MENSQRNEGILTGIIASVNLTECHGMAISGYPMSFRAGCNREGARPRGNLLAETGHCSSLSKCLPTQLVQQ